MSSKENCRRLSERTRRERTQWPRRPTGTPRKKTNDGGVAEEAERRAGFRRWFWGATALEGRLHMAWEGEKLNVTLGCAV